MKIQKNTYARKYAALCIASFLHTKSCSDLWESIGVLNGLFFSEGHVSAAQKSRLTCNMINVFQGESK